MTFLIKKNNPTIMWGVYAARVTILDEGFH